MFFFTILNQRHGILHVTEQKQTNLLYQCTIFQSDFSKLSMIFLQKKKTHFLIMIAGLGSMIEIMKAILIGSITDKRFENLICTYSFEFSLQVILGIGTIGILHYILPLPMAGFCCINVTIFIIVCSDKYIFHQLSKHKTRTVPSFTYIFF